MKRIFCISIILAFLIPALNTVHAFTCGKKFFSKGDLSFQVLIDCGEPVIREVIGYTLTPDQRREMVIERWVYGPVKGFYQVLIFEGGVLIKEEKVISK